MKWLLRIAFVALILGVIAAFMFGPTTEISLFVKGGGFKPYQIQRFYFSGIPGKYKLDLWPWPTKMHDESSDWVELKKVGYGQTYYYRDPGLCVDCQFAIQVSSDGKVLKLKALGVIEANEVHFVYLNPQPSLEPGQDYTIKGNKGLGSLVFRPMGDGKLYWPKPKYSF